MGRQDPGVHTDGEVAAHARHTGSWVLRTNTVTFFLKTRLNLREDRLLLVTPRTILGVIPTGRTEHAFPLGDLASVRISAAAHPDRLIVAAMLVGAAVLSPVPALTVVTAALAAAFLFLGVIAVVRVEDRAGRVRRIPVCFLQRRVAAAAVRQVERARAAAGREPAG